MAQGGDLFAPFVLLSSPAGTAGVVRQSGSRITRKPMNGASVSQKSEPGGLQASRAIRPTPAGERS